MPKSWDPEVYRQRAKEWQEKADALPAGNEGDTCLTIAQGYARLATLIDQSERPQPTPLSPASLRRASVPMYDHPDD
jgi:hypothetical protein